MAAEDVYLSGERIAAPIGDADPVDVTGRLVLPGLVDLHVHVFRGQEAGVDADAWGATSGVTAMLDAGSAGAHLFDAFRLTSIDPVATQVRAMVNVSTIGITSFVLRGELFEARYRDHDAVVRTVQRHRDVVTGIKVRASANVGGEGARDALTFAREVADEVQLPLMVHLGPRPAEVDEILESLRSGDILTHCFSGWPENSLLDKDDRPRRTAIEARERGVIFDVGHGASSFDPLVAHHMVSAGFMADTISSDIHSHSVAEARTLPAVMNKFLALGVELTEVMTCVTSTPARVGGFTGGVGRIATGERADLAVIEAIERPYTLMVGHDPMTSPVTLEVAMTIRGGRPVHRGGRVR
jgi:dihydroorotase